MTWLVTGAGGQLGRELVLLLQSRGIPVTAVTRAELDITEPAAVAGLVETLRPQVIANCAAYTAVDAAETDQPAAAAVNTTGPELLAAAARAAGARLLHLSTDYVFRGDANRPYREVDPVDPATVYGRTKAAGEAAVLSTWPAGAFVVRTAWVYGRHGRNFPARILELAAAGEPLRVVADQHGQPTWTGDLAAALVELAAADAAPGIYHCAGGGEATWYTLACEVLRLAGLDPSQVQPITTADFPRPAPRPAYSVLDCAKWQAAGLTPLPDWRDALRRSGIAAQ